MMPTQIMGPFSLQDRVRFKPSERTWYLLRKIQDDRGASLEHAPQVDADGYMELPAWQFMREFGPHMYVGSMPVVEDNKFYVVNGQGATK